MNTDTDSRASRWRRFRKSWGSISNKERGQSIRVTAKFLSLAALLAGSAVAGPALTTDKTLVSWVCLANTTQRCGKKQA